MKRNTIACVIACTILLVSFSGMQRANASINNYNWISSLARNSYDAFYGAYITAYAEDGAALLVVSVFNDFFLPNTPINVSAVKVGFDWGINYTSNECSSDSPFSISSRQSHVFTINFTIPSTSFASNLVTHSYTIYVEHVNSTVGDKRIIDTWTQNGSGFAVFSSDQADAYDNKKLVDAYPTSGYSGFPIVSAKARELFIETSIAESMGSDAYVRGDFSAASQHYADALDLVQQALSNETDTWSTFENSITDILRGGSSLLAFQGYAWLLFGIGFMLISIGLLVYLLRKKPQVKTS